MNVIGRLIFSSGLYKNIAQSVHTGWDTINKKIDWANHSAFSKEATTIHNTPQDAEFEPQFHDE
jgi:hypothetical protein